MDQFMRGLVLALLLFLQADPAVADVLIWNGELTPDVEFDISIHLVQSSMGGERVEFTIDDVLSLEAHEHYSGLYLTLDDYSYDDGFIHATIDGCISSDEVVVVNGWFGAGDTGEIEIDISTTIPSSLSGLNTVYAWQSGCGPTSAYFCFGYRQAGTWSVNRSGGVVPEPATILLLGGGLAGLGVFRKKFRKA